MTCKECDYKDDCCFYRKEEEDWTCVYEMFKRNRDEEENAIEMKRRTQKKGEDKK